MRDTARFYTSVLSEAGIILQEEDEVAQNAAQEAFAKGESVNLDIAVHTSQQDTESRIWQKDMRQLLLSTGAQLPVKDKTVQKPTAAGKAGNLLGTFRLVSAAQSSIIDTSTTSAMQHLAGWKPLPDWPTSAPNHGLREPPADESDNQQQSGRGYPTAFGSSSSTHSKSKSAASAASRRTGLGSTSNAARARREPVVLVPTESEPSAYVRQEPRQRDLNDFLASGSEEEDEEEASDEEESDESTEEVAAVQEAEEETTDSELEDSEEEASSAEEEEDTGNNVSGARQPLLQNRREG